MDVCTAPLLLSQPARACFLAVPRLNAPDRPVGLTKGRGDAAPAVERRGPVPIPNIADTFAFHVNAGQEPRLLAGEVADFILS
jgi:hypothetical protein